MVYCSGIKQKFAAEIVSNIWVCLNSSVQLMYGSKHSIWSLFYQLGSMCSLSGDHLIKGLRIYFICIFC